MKKCKDKRCGRAWVVSAFFSLLALIHSPAAAATGNVRLGLPLHEPAALFIVAADQGYFAQEGLKATVKDYVSGAQALQNGLFTGEADIVSTTDVPAVFASFARNDFTIPAAISTMNNFSYVTARAKSGIKKPEELRGKRIGVQKGTASHFFLSLFLPRHRLSERDVKIIFKKFEELPDALAGGEIDAFVSNDVFIHQAEAKLGGNALVIFEEGGLYGPTAILTGSKRFIRENPAAVQALLKALIRAEEFVRRQPRESQEIVSRRMKLPLEKIAAAWKNLTFAVQLPQSLLLALEDEARWARDNRLVETKTLPNYLDFIDVDALKSVRPRSVGIIR